MKNNLSVFAMSRPITVGRDDLFVALEQAFRRHKACRACSFSLPEPVEPQGPGAPNWTIIPSPSCSDECRDVLDQLIAKFQATHRLREA